VFNPLTKQFIYLLRSFIRSHINGSVWLMCCSSLILFCILILGEHVTYFVFILSIIVERILHLVVRTIIFLLSWLYWAKPFEVLLLTMLKAEDWSTSRIDTPYIPLTASWDLFFYSFDFIELLLPIRSMVSGHWGVHCPQIKQVSVVPTKLFPFFIFLRHILIWYIHLVWIICVVVTVYVPFREWNWVKLFHVFILVFNLLMQTWLHWDDACLLVQTTHWCGRCSLLVVVLMLIDAFISL